MGYEERIRERACGCRADMPTGLFVSRCSTHKHEELKRQIRALDRASRRQLMKDLRTWDS